MYQVFIEYLLYYVSAILDVLRDGGVNKIEKIQLSCSLHSSGEDKQ